MSSGKITLGIILDGAESGDWASVCDYIRAIMDIPCLEVKIIRAKETVVRLHDEDYATREGICKKMESSEILAAEQLALYAMPYVYRYFDGFILFAGASAVNMLSAGIGDALHHLLLQVTTGEARDRKPVIVFPSGDRLLFANARYKASVSYLQSVGWQFICGTHGALADINEGIGVVRSMLEKLGTRRGPLTLPPPLSPKINRDNGQQGGPPVSLQRPDGAIQGCSEIFHVQNEQGASGDTGI